MSQQLLPGLPPLPPARPMTEDDWTRLEARIDAAIEIHERGRRRRLVLAMAAALLVLLVAVAATWWHSTRPTPGSTSTSSASRAPASQPGPGHPFARPLDGTDPRSQCEAEWRTGRWTDGGSAPRPARRLRARRGREPSRSFVFPDDAAGTCERLGIDDLPDDYADEQPALRRALRADRRPTHPRTAGSASPTARCATAQGTLRSSATTAGRSRPIRRASRATARASGTGSPTTTSASCSSTAGRGRPAVSEYLLPGLPPLPPPRAMCGRTTGCACSPASTTRSRLPTAPARAHPRAGHRRAAGHRRGDRDRAWRPGRPGEPARTAAHAPRRPCSCSGERNFSQIAAIRGNSTPASGLAAFDAQPMAAGRSRRGMAPPHPARGRRPADGARAAGVPATESPVRHQRRTQTCDCFPQCSVLWSSSASPSPARRPRIPARSRPCPRPRRPTAWPTWACLRRTSPRTSPCSPRPAPTRTPRSSTTRSSTRTAPSSSSSSAPWRSPTAPPAARACGRTPATAARCSAFTRPRHRHRPRRLRLGQPRLLLGQQAVQRRPARHAGPGVELGRGQQALPPAELAGGVDGRLGQRGGPDQARHEQRDLLIARRSP